MTVEIFILQLGTWGCGHWLHFLPLYATIVHFKSGSYDWRADFQVYFKELDKSTLSTVHVLQPFFTQSPIFSAPYVIGLLANKQFLGQLRSYSKKIEQMKDMEWIPTAVEWKMHYEVQSYTNMQKL